MDLMTMSVLELEGLAFRMVEQRDNAIDNLKVILPELDRKRRMPPPVNPAVVQTPPSDAPEPSAVR